MNSPLSDKKLECVRAQRRLGLFETGKTAAMNSVDWRLSFGANLLEHGRT